MVGKTQSKEDKIFPEIAKYIEYVEKTGSFDAGWYQVLRQELTEIARTNVRFADARRAYLASLSGQDADFQDAINNLRANNHIADARLENYAHLLNHGYAIRAFECAGVVMTERHVTQSMDVFSAIVSNGGFQLLNSYVCGAQERQEVLQASPLFQKVKEVVQVMEQLKVSDLDVVKMKDVAGEVLREHNRIWAGDATHVTTLNVGQDDPQLLIEYFVGVAPTVAAQMSWDLAERLIDRELDKPGVCLNFLGIAA